MYIGGILSLQPIVTVDIAGIEHIAKATGFLNMAISVAWLISIPLTGNFYVSYILLNQYQVVIGGYIVI